MFDIKRITGITQDSREVKPGFMFAALKGEKSDGFDYIDQAIKQGAVAILTDRSCDVPEGVELIIDQNPRLKLAQIAAEFYSRQPENIVAVTGTNGKTSVVNFTQQIWQGLGHKAASIGTMTGKLTTADAVSLMQTLAAHAKDGVTHLAMEASSHGLDQYRLDGARIKAAGYTNISHDHLDYHGDMQAYLTAKTRLFSELLPSDGIAVLNADAPEFAALKEKCTAPIIAYGKQGEHIKIIKTAPTDAGQAVELTIFGHHYKFDLPLFGEFQLYNILCALGMSFLSAQPDKSEIDARIDILKTIKPVRGRLENIPGHPQNAKIFIDFAHTPDALKTVLNTIRAATKGSLMCVFGCGGAYRI
jgi:UDP-N-acetylmuramoyl-L-alanyl-D-glutamate--2,6-diaminopimelate ligase